MTTILATEKRDWTFIVFSSLSGFMLIGFYLLMQAVFPKQPDIAILITFLIYAIFFDVRHLFSTYSRTYLDKVYFKENKKWLNASFFLIIAVPLFVLFLVAREGVYDTGFIFTYFLRITTILGFYHLVKQNWGFMAIYKKKMNEPEDGSDRWDKLVLLSGSFIPFILAAIIYPVWFPSESFFITPEPGLVEYVAQKWTEISLYTLLFSVILLLIGYVFQSRPQYKYVSRNLGLFFLAVFVLMQALLKWGTNVLYVVLTGVVLLFVVSLVMSIRKAINQQVLNTKKWAVLISSLVLYGGILLLPIENKSIVVMAITIPHNIQYLTFVNFFNYNYYSASKQEHGIAKKMAQKAVFFIAVSFIYAVVYELFRTGTKFISFGVAPETEYVLGNAIAILFLSMSLHHYYLDAVIWRVRKDKSISQSV